jgi:predicted nucleic acid-binding protein
MIYCDTSFLLALYVEADAFYEQTGRIVSRFKEPIPYTLLGKLELLNGIRRLKGHHGISAKQEQVILEQIEADEAEGFLIRTSLNQVEHYQRAQDLSRKHTPQLLARSLDILHVAAAVVLEAKQLASFDRRQRALARAAGLMLLPASMDGK